MMGFLSYMGPRWYEYALFYEIDPETLFESEAEIAFSIRLDREIALPSYSRDEG